MPPPKAFNPQWVECMPEAGRAWFQHVVLGLVLLHQNQYNYWMEVSSAIQHISITDNDSIIVGSKPAAELPKIHAEPMKVAPEPAKVAISTPKLAAETAKSPAEPLKVASEPTKVTPKIQQPDPPRAAPETVPPPVELEDNKTGHKEGGGFLGKLFGRRRQEELRRDDVPEHLLTPSSEDQLHQMTMDRPEFNRTRVRRPRKSLTSPALITSQQRTSPPPGPDPVSVASKADMSDISDDGLLDSFVKDIGPENYHALSPAPVAEIAPKQSGPRPPPGPPPPSALEAGQRAKGSNHVPAPKPSGSESAHATRLAESDRNASRVSETASKSFSKPSPPATRPPPTNSDSGTGIAVADSGPVARPPLQPLQTEPAAEPPIRPSKEGGAIDNARKPRPPQGMPPPSALASVRTPQVDNIQTAKPSSSPLSDPRAKPIGAGDVDQRDDKPRAAVRPPASIIMPKPATRSKSNENEVGAQDDVPASPKPIRIGLVLPPKVDLTSVTVNAVCGECDCSEFALNPFKPGSCNNCFHKH